MMMMTKTKLIVENILRMLVVLFAQLVFTMVLTITEDAKAAVTWAWLYTIAGACVSFFAMMIYEYDE